MSTSLIDWNAHTVLVQETDIISETTTNINADVIPKYFRKLLSVCTKNWSENWCHLFVMQYEKYSKGLWNKEQ